MTVSSCTVSQNCPVSKSRRRNEPGVGACAEGSVNSNCTVCTCRAELPSRIDQLCTEIGEESQSCVNIVACVGTVGGLVTGTVENQTGVFPLTCTPPTLRFRSLLSGEVLASARRLALPDVRD